MIPKIIHYTWFSGEEFPKDIKQCIDSWHKYMPDWEFKLWDRKAAEDLHIRFIDEALSVRKWAFAADALRVYAVYKYGGIYLDTDCEVIQSLEPLLNDKCFIGKENIAYIDVTHRTFQTLTSHCFGAEAGHPFLKKCLDYYQDRPFILSNCSDLDPILRYDQTILPYIQAIIAKDFGFDTSKLLANKHQYLEDTGIHIYPAESMDTMPNSQYVRHMCMGGWLHKGDSKKQIKPSLRYRLKWFVFNLKSLFYYDYIRIKLT